MHNSMRYALGLTLPAIVKAGVQPSNRGFAAQPSEGSGTAGTPKFGRIFAVRQAPHTTRDTTAPAPFRGLAA